MIRCIAALDSESGIADEHGIPWRGLVPGDVKYYRDKVRTGTILMGYGTYLTIKKPYHNRINYVATKDNRPLKEGFAPVADARRFIQETDDDAWIMGGAGLFASVLDLADELYLTRIDKDFHCTKFFPEFESMFNLAQKSEPMHENGLTYHFEIWKKKT